MYVGGICVSELVTQDTVAYIISTYVLLGCESRNPPYQINHKTSRMEINSTHITDTESLQGMV